MICFIRYFGFRWRRCLAKMESDLQTVLLRKANLKKARISHTVCSHLSSGQGRFREMERPLVIRESLLMLDAMI